MARDADLPSARPSLSGGGLTDRLRDFTRLPREQALGRLGYDLKRPVFALPFYRYSLPGLSATTLVATPSDPWPGNAEVGNQLLADGTSGPALSAVRAGAPAFAGMAGTMAQPIGIHDFAWLRDLRAVGGDAARRQARALVRAWLDRYRAWDAVAWAPLATGERLGNWLGCYEFFAASAEIEFRHRLIGSIGQQAQHLARVLPAGLAGVALIAALKGLIYAGVALPNRAAWRRRGCDLLCRALATQILGDGGHAERNPSRHLALLRDLIDIRAALNRSTLDQADAAPTPDAIPPELNAAIAAMAPILRMVRHGDGGLALFNGATEDEGWAIDLALQRAGGARRPLAQARDSGFQRLRAGRTLVLADAGAPPERGLDHDAHAGTLSFEMSVGRERLIVNCGARPGDAVWHHPQRATAAHSTLTLDDTNSAELMAGGGLARPAHILHCRRNERDGDIWLDLAHDGYTRAFGLIHRRRLYLSADGADLRGEDRLEPSRAVDEERPFAIRFHLHPNVRANLSQDGAAALLGLPKGGGWQLRAAGARIALEPSIYLGKPHEIRRTQQVVLTAECPPGGAAVKWALRRLDGKRPAPVKKPHTS